MISVKWQVDRGQLNHNWLQNSVLIGLRHALSTVSGGVRPANIRKTIVEDILRWQERRHDLSLLLERFENEMSPKVFFDVLPLSRCSDETKAWLVPVTHELWLQREMVKEKISANLMAFEYGQKCYQALNAALEKVPEAASVEDVQALEPLLLEFTKACEALSGSISSLPHEIRCC